MQSFAVMVASAPAFRVAVGVTLGILLGRVLPEGTTCSTALLSLLVLSVVTLSIVSRRGIDSSTVLLLGLTVCLLTGAMKYVIDRDRMPRLDSVEHRRVVLTGTVVTDLDSLGTLRRFILRAERLRRDSVEIGCSTDVSVTLKLGRDDTAATVLAYGCSVAVSGVIERPADERNPGEMSMRNYDEALGITHLLEVHGMRNVRIVDRESGVWGLRRVVFPARRWMLEKFEGTTGGEEGEFLKGLILGERGGIQPRTRDAFVNAGVAHVLAVSGSNVAVVAGALFLLLEILRVPRNIRIVPMLAGLVLYMLVTGSQPPVVRATIMATVILCGKAVQRPVSAWNCIGFSAMVIFAVDARQLFDIGFQLSYGAVLSLMAIYPVFNRWITKIPHERRWQMGVVWILRVCAVSLAATVGTLPLTAVCFGKVSVIGILANIVVIPATELSVLLGMATLGAALFSEGIARAYAALNWHLLHWTLVLTRLAGFSSVAYITTARFSAIDALSYYALLLGCVTPSPRRAQHLGIALLFSAVVVVVIRPVVAPDRDAQTLRVSIIDVGQGDAILVECPDGRTLLVDTGPRGFSFDAGEKTVVPFLQRRGIASIDLLLVSHLHADHLGGLAAVVDAIPVRRILVEAPCALRMTLGTLLPDGIPAPDSCTPGQALPVSPGVRAYVLYPIAGTPTGRLGGNESIVLKIVYGTCSILLTGDAETGEEEEMIERYGDWMRSQILKAGHHGSSTSSSARFLEVVKPERVAISVGRHNKFRHPSLSVLRRCAAYGIEVSRTDEEGALMFETDGRRMWTTAWR